jgi:hypothetical protein
VDGTGLGRYPPSDVCVSDAEPPGARTSDLYSFLVKRTRQFLKT